MTNHESDPNQNSPSPSATSADPRPNLHCLGGHPAPESIVVAWRVFESLPEAARNKIWDVLAPFVVNGPGQEVAEISSTWCQTHGVVLRNLEQAIEACHFFLTQAARLNLPEPAIREDIEAISREGQPGLKALLAHFAEMNGFVRQRILEGSLLDHGKVFTGLDWRIDTIGASDRGLGLDVPVALLTLRHQEGCDDTAVKGKTSLYLTPEAVSKLRQVCEQLEGMLEGTSARSEG